VRGEPPRPCAAPAGCRAAQLPTIKEAEIVSACSTGSAGKYGTEVTNIKDTERVNTEYYETLYARRVPLLDRVMPYVSYDQCSKARRNIRAIEKYAEICHSKVIDVFDFGCGRGSFLLMFPCRPLRAYGLDISPSATKNLEARDWGRDRSFNVVSLEEFDNQKLLEHFDVCCISHVLEHVPDEIAVLDTLARSLRPGGTLVINVPINEIFDDPRHVRSYNIAPLTKAVEAVGLGIVKCVESDRLSPFIHWHEINGTGGVFGKLFFKGIRGFLGAMPLSVHEWLERWIAPVHQCTQLVLVAKRAVASADFHSSSLDETSR